MAVYHRLHIRPQLVDFAVNEAFDHAAATLRINRIGVEVVFHDVAGGYQNRRERARHQIAVWLARVADTHVSVGIEHAFLGKDTIGGDKVLDACRIDSGGGRRGLRCSGINIVSYSQSARCEYPDGGSGMFVTILY